jgi:hypothetical protein
VSEGCSAQAPIKVAARMRFVAVRSDVEYFTGTPLFEGEVMRANPRRPNIQSGTADR